jgi:hypothetical protein
VITNQQIRNEFRYIKRKGFSYKEQAHAVAFRLTRDHWRYRAISEQERIERAAEYKQVKERAMEMLENPRLMAGPVKRANMPK